LVSFDAFCDADGEVDDLAAITLQPQPTQVVTEIRGYTSGS
jgi:hypothetical protein